ncbi:hypothetical protein [Mycolicibacterium llatzerense]|uniref:hypothetical protein n=1 Tax=Mycolicibacterium llatzerense TaxID=280871 RepID=UPI0008DE6C94|nr:hypothetical protein [Mycolicibacterium llatzerense]
MLIVVRDGLPFAPLESPDVGRLLNMAATAARGYSAEALALVFEGVVPTEAPNPLTGQGWQRGEADDARRRHDGIARGWAHEALVVSIVTWDGAERATTQRLTTVAERMSWGGIMLQDKVVGVATPLRLALAESPIDPAAVPDPGDHMVAASGAPFYSQERGRIVLDVGCTRLLDRQLDPGSATLLTADAEQADQWRSEGLMDWQIAEQPALHTG